MSHRTIARGAASAFALALVAGSVALAQQPVTGPVPQGVPGWKQGMPKAFESSPLAPHSPRLTATPIEKIPLDKLKLPTGFKAEIWASGMPGARMMTRGDKGTVFSGSRTIGRVYATVEKNGKRESKILVQGLSQPNGVLFHKGALYVVAINKVLRFDDIESKLDSKPEDLKPVDLTEKFDLPKDEHHGWKFLALGPDGKIYIPVGALCNLCEVNPGTHAHIRRYTLDGSGMEIVARGVRNTVGLTFHPTSNELWFTDNGRDWSGNNGPQDELNRLPANKIGANFGFPYCHAEGITDPDLKKPDSCAGVIRPAALMGPHSAALGLRFYTGTMFPAAYKNVAFVARRGSWNRDQKFGYDVVAVTTNADGTNATVKPFLTGLLDEKGNAFHGRPVDVQVQPDGSLLVADEENGAIYRISYNNARTAEAAGAQKKN